jgi:hypothetical protein
VLYLVITLVVVALMQVVESKTRVPGYLGARG